MTPDPSDSPPLPTAGEPTLAELCADFQLAACAWETSTESHESLKAAFQQARNAILDRVTALQSKLADAERERKEIGWAMRNVLAHTGLPPAPTEELLRGLLESVARIARAALTPPAGHATHQEEGSE